MDDLIGRTLGQYEIVELIDAGGMATVYRARQPRLQRDVAVKVMLPELAADPDFRERFEREAQAIANLRHPGILTVYDYGETADGQLYLAVEYVAGGTLQDRLERAPATIPGAGHTGGALPPEEVVDVVAQVAEALDYAHRQGVVHRDVKPNNILLNEEQRPLLADFGLAKPVQGERRLTASGVILGTPDYMAPEQAQGLAIDGRTDIYALGVVLFEALTGQHPYSADSPLSVIIKHVNERMPLPSERNPALPQALDQVVAQATAKSPDERYQRAGDMARALRAALIPTDMRERVEAPPAIAAPSERKPASSLRQKRAANRLGATVGVALLVAVAAAVALFVSGRLPGEGAAREAGALPTAQPGETMILVAQFKAQPGSDRYDVSQRVFDKLASDLRQLDEKDVTVHQVPEVIESSEAAVALGQRYGAATVIWGFYDDIGINPNIEAIQMQQASPVSVGLERFNLDADDVASFRLYIARDLPEEVSFLTAVSLLQAFMLQGRLEKALSYMMLAIDNLPADPQFRSGGETVLFMQAIMEMMLGDASGAIEHIDQAIDIAPDTAQFYTWRGTIYAITAETGLALADLERALAIDPTDLIAYGTKAYVKWALGDLQAALEAYSQIVALAPDGPMARVGQGMVLFDMGDLAAAHAAWDEAAASEPPSPMIALVRGLAYEKAGQPDRASIEYAQMQGAATGTDYFSQFLRLVTNPEEAYAPAYFFLIECVTREIHGERQAALKQCERALAIDPGYFDALWKRGQLYAAGEEWERAVADYTAAIQADPGWPWVYYLRAQALSALGRVDEAQADLSQALRLEPPDELRRDIETHVSK